MPAGEDGAEPSRPKQRWSDLPAGLREHRYARSRGHATSTEIPPNTREEISPQQERSLHDGRASCQPPDYGRRAKYRDSSASTDFGGVRRPGSDERIPADLYRGGKAAKRSARSHDFLWSSWV